MRHGAGATIVIAVAATLAVVVAYASPGSAADGSRASGAERRGAAVVQPLAPAPAVGAGYLPGPFPQLTPSIAGSQAASFPRCGPARDALAAYGWPVQPFHRQHPIRGAFGDPRTVERSAEPQDGPGSLGSFQFHNGIDIVADDGTPVYPVLTGIAEVKHTREVSVRTSGGRIFQYWHIVPRVHSGQRVVQDQTVLGTIQKGAQHVHLGEIDGMRIVNPLAPGHIGPYQDTQAPVVHAVLAREPGGHDLPLGRLAGKVALIADAADAQPLPFWGPWFGKPVAPALIRWRIVAADGTVMLPWATAFDVRLREPPPVRFWRSYAQGTYQNFPVLDDHLYWGKPGRYLFRLTHDLIDTNVLADGAYTVEVKAGDVCGNTGMLRRRVTIDNADAQPDVKSWQPGWDASAGPLTPAAVAPAARRRATSS